MSRYLTLAALAAALFVAAPSAEARQSLPEGSYLDSCRNLYVDGDTLYGECQDSRGKWKKTWISGYAYCDGDIVNNNGVLDCQGGRLPDQDEPAAPAAGDLPAGDWSKTCRDAVLDGYVLRASCKDNRGTWRPTWIDMRQCKSNTVGNDDGLLVCLAAAPPKAAVVALRDTLPGGDWTETCRSAAVKNYQMRGECFDGNGWLVSDLDLKKCKHGRVSNSGGRLICN